MMVMMTPLMMLIRDEAVKNPNRKNYREALPAKFQIKKKFAKTANLDGICFLVLENCPRHLVRESQAWERLARVTRVAEESPPICDSRGAIVSKSSMRPTHTSTTECACTTLQIVCLCVSICSFSSTGGRLCWVTYFFHARFTLTMYTLFVTRVIIVILSIQLTPVIVSIHRYHRRPPDSARSLGPAIHAHGARR